MNQPVNPSDFFVFSLHLLTSKTIFFNIQTSTFVQQGEPSHLLQLCQQLVPSINIFIQSCTSEMVGFDEKNTFQEAQGLISKRKKKERKKNDCAILSSGFLGFRKHQQKPNVNNMNPTGANRFKVSTLLLSFFLDFQACPLKTNLS